MHFSVNDSGVLRSQIDNKVIIAVRTGAFAVLDETNVVVGFSRSFFLGVNSFFSLLPFLFGINMKCTKGKTKGYIKNPTTFIPVNYLQ